ncbi:MAG TPA: nitroreductase family protein, partial [Nitrososphaerales archaeon]|nr:nitroreductase family protein [Nitrososphaerales archaeon]
METYEAIRTKLDIRQFASRHVESGVKKTVLEAARLTASSMNSQHWRFILVQDSKNIQTLAKDSSTGSWVRGADFAIIVTIDPKIPGSVIDAGRVVQDMQLAAWEQGVGSGV